MQTLWRPKPVSLEKPRLESGLEWGLESKSSRKVLGMPIDREMGRWDYFVPKTPIKSRAYDIMFLLYLNNIYLINNYTAY